MIMIMIVIMISAFHGSRMEKKLLYLKLSFLLLFYSTETTHRTSVVGCWEHNIRDLQLPTQ